MDDDETPLPTDVVARFDVRKMRSWRSSYHRILALRRGSFLTMDPGNFKDTNVWEYQQLKRAAPTDKHPDEFVVEVAGKWTYTFRCAYRAHALAQLLRLRAQAVPSTIAHAPQRAARVRRDGARADVALRVLPHALVELEADPSHPGGGRVLQEYLLLNRDLEDLLNLLENVSDLKKEGLEAI